MSDSLDYFAFLDIMIMKVYTKKYPEVRYG